MREPRRIGLTIDQNLYYAVGQQGLVLYGPTWKPRHEKYTDLRLWQQAHGFDQHSLAADPQLSSPAEGDFRRRATSPAHLLKAVPEPMPIGIVPDQSKQVRTPEGRP